MERHEKERYPFLRSLPVCCPYDVAELELGALVGEETQAQYAKKLGERRNKRLLSNKQVTCVNIIYAHHIVYCIASAIFPCYMCTCICA